MGNFMQAEQHEYLEGGWRHVCGCGLLRTPHCKNLIRKKSHFDMRDPR